MTPTRPTTSRHRQRGSVYIAVLATSMIVTVIGVSALMASRVHHHNTMRSSDYSQARLHARSAIEMGLHIIHHDPLWRQQRGGGVWFEKMALGDGLMSLHVRDAYEGDVTDGHDRPVILTGTGVVGQSRYKMQVMLFTEPGHETLQVATLAGNRVRMYDAIVSSNQVLHANDHVEAHGQTHVYAPAHSAREVRGSTYYEETREAVDTRSQPDMATIMAYYLSNGTVIDHSELDLPGKNLLENAGFDLGEIEPWYVVDEDAVLALDTQTRKGGTYSLLVTDRQSADAGPRQDITAAMVNDAKYTIVAYLRNAEGNVEVRHMKATIELQHRPSPTSQIQTKSWSTSTTHVKEKWKKLEDDITVSWSGALISAELRIETDESLEGFRVDHVELLENVAKDERRIRRVLLSPEHNPFGEGVTNPQGIYIIKCHGNIVTIENCRIIGTLVILDPDSDSAIRGAVNWQPAQQNFPALLTDKRLTIATQRNALSEATLYYNFNPPGTPYPYPNGQSNANVEDVYPSRIRGLIYSGDQLEIEGSPVIDGQIITAGDLNIYAEQLDLNYSAAALNNPPPGFPAVTRRLRIRPGSWQRVVD